MIVCPSFEPLFAVGELSLAGLVESGITLYESGAYCLMMESLCNLLGCSETLHILRHLHLFGVLRLQWAP